MRALAVVVLVACAAPAAAAPGELRAQELYRSGNAHYNLAEFDAAIADFKAAYELSAAPGLLFNLAQAARLGHHNEQALHYYKTYLRLRPDATNRADVEAHIAMLQTVPPPGRGLMIGGSVTAAAGVATLAAAIGLGVASSQASDTLPPPAKKGGMGTPAPQQIDDTGQREAIAADVLYAVGGVATVAGTIAAIVGWRRGAVRHLGVAPGPRGAAVTASIAF
jgi:tetratricopeptide (TPR) repeat protein